MGQLDAAILEPLREDSRGFEEIAGSKEGGAGQDSAPRAAPELLGQ